MHYKFLFVTLFSSALLSGMEQPANYPPRVTMEEIAKPLADLMPPLRMEMTDYDAVPGKFWTHNDAEMEVYRTQFTQHPLYKQICASPIEHAELVDTLISEAKLRICSHASSGCMAVTRPCMPAFWSLFFAMRAYNADYHQESCCLHSGMSCFLAIATCGSCSKNVRSLRGITKTTQKTYVALELFKRLKELEDKKNH